MNEGICHIGLQRLSSNDQDQVLSYSTEVSSFTAFGPCCVETFMDKRGKQKREKGLHPGHPDLKSRSGPSLLQPHATFVGAAGLKQPGCNLSIPAQLSEATPSHTFGELLPEISRPPPTVV